MEPLPFRLIGTISASSLPAFWASAAFFWDVTANSSWRFLEMSYFFARFSAVSPMETNACG